MIVRTGLRRMVRLSGLWNMSAVLSCLIVAVVLTGCSPKNDEPLLVVGDTVRTCWLAEDPGRYFDAVEDDGHPRQSPRGLTGGHKIVIGSEVRNGFVLPDGRRLERRLELKGKVRLRFSVARAPGIEVPLILSVIVGETSGKETTLRTLEMNSNSGAWLGVSVDLSEFDGKVIDLGLEFQVVGNKQHPWPIFVANPEFITKGRYKDLPDVLLISVDTLRADRLSLLGDGPKTTPNLDRWAQEKAVVFSEAVAAAPWTLPAHVSLFTGLDAARHGVNHDVGGLRVQAGDGPVTGLEFMAETLRRAGYSTAAFTGGAYVRHDFGFAQGFDVFSAWPDRGRDLDELPTGVERTVDFFRSRRPEPAFVFLHTYAVHDPYRAWPGYAREIGPREKGLMKIALQSQKNVAGLGFRKVNRLFFRLGKGKKRAVKPDELALVGRMYDSGVRFADHHLGGLFEDLKRRRLDQNLIVVLTSDHGEALGEGGRFGHADLTDEVLRVPLLMSFPDRHGSGTVIKRQVRQVDIWPTVADVIGLPPQADWDGVSMTQLVDGGQWAGSGEAWAYSAAPNRGIGLRLEGITKMIFDNTAWRIPGPREQLFDLETDRSEETNLADTDPRTESLLAKVEQYLHHAASGLRLSLSNRSKAAIIGTLQGKMIRPVGTKILTPAGQPLKWVEMGNAEFLVPPDSDVTYSFEKVFGGNLRVRGSIDDVSFNHSVDVRSLEEPAILSFDGAEWVSGPAPGDSAKAVVSVWWHGIESALGEGPVSHDSAVVEQLKALGYVD